MPDPLYITFLWHMHQPYYKDPVTAEYALPWTYLHAVKDYYDMAAIVDDTPDARVTFNLVPSLIEQILDYAAGTAVDPFLVRGWMPPGDMAAEERLFLLENFFSANRQRLIEPNRRYLELFHMAGGGSSDKLRERLKQFNDQDLLDLQVWFFLAWTGEAARRRFPELQELVKKGRHFTPLDKEALFAIHGKILSDIIPLYQKLHQEGKAELSVTPYFHPILPLLCDTRVALTAMPKAPLPAARLRHPEDARAQVVRALDYFREVFGFTPRGMWPAEGAVSDEALDIIAGCGIQWAATDQDVLGKSIDGGLGPDKKGLYHPYAYKSGEKGLRLLFRDHLLSDLIGFTYSQWDTAKGVQDFVGRLKGIQARLGSGGVVPIMLDGENAWEYYPDNGYDFLRRLYSGIATTGGMRLATCSEAIEKVKSARVLQRIHPGSWINADYGIWIGHPEENMGWDLLARTREAAVSGSPAVAELLAGTGEGDETARLVCKSLYAAEGSDWFWWYGDDHFSSHSDRFDLLFRRHLMNVYGLLQLEAPHELYEPIKKLSPAGLVREPTACITPRLDGLAIDYFEWMPAGLYDLTKQASAMHSSENLLQSFFYGYDRNNLYVRIDGEKPLKETLPADTVLTLHIISSQEYRLCMTLPEGSGPVMEKHERQWRESGHTGGWKIIRVCEAQIPLVAVKADPAGKLFAYVTLTCSGEETGRWPADAPMQLVYKGERLELENWLI
ncbi:MAG: glycoside hydrolase [Geobacter sp.]|nr:glycoside hydrolase [Geobacter sp.]